jgi:DNA-binding XRE family transcriptional regulator
VPYAAYERLVEEAEMLRDIRAHDDAKQAIDTGKELVPADLTFAILDGANPIRVWREYRGLSQQQLSGAAGISAPYLSQIESDRHEGSTRVLAGLAAALHLSEDDLAPS